MSEEISWDIIVQSLNESTLNQQEINEVLNSMKESMENKDAYRVGFEKGASGQTGAQVHQGLQVIKAESGASYRAAINGYRDGLGRFKQENVEYLSRLGEYKK